MLTLEYKLRGSRAQLTAIDEAIRTVQFIRNTCVRLWMDGHGITANELQAHCAVLAQRFPFVAKLNSQARQQAVVHQHDLEPRTLGESGATADGSQGRFVSVLVEPRISRLQPGSVNLLKRRSHVHSCTRLQWRVQWRARGDVFGG